MKKEVDFEWYRKMAFYSLLVIIGDIGWAIIDKIRVEALDKQPSLQSWVMWGILGVGVLGFGIAARKIMGDTDKLKK